MSAIHSDVWCVCSEQLEEIVKSRLADVAADVFANDAVELCARKVQPRTPKISVIYRCKYFLKLLANTSTQ